MTQRDLYKALKINFMKWFHLNNTYTCTSNISMSKNSIFSPKKTVIFHPSKQVFTDTER